MGRGEKNHFVKTNVKAKIQSTMNYNLFIDD